MPFAGYKDFGECVRRNSKKDNPRGYCATIQRKVEGPQAGRGGRMRESATDAQQASEFYEDVLSPADQAALAVELKVASDPMLDR